MNKYVYVGYVSRDTSPIIEYYRNKTLSVEEYLNKIRPFFKDIINNLKTSDACH